MENSENKNDDSASYDLLQGAKNVLEYNDKGTFTVPSGDFYPHQILWDSCFVAIGRRHYDVNRAQTEILSLLRAQWSNGMIPHIIFSDGDKYRIDRDIWRSWTSPYSPDHLSTSGMTQPPMLADAIVKVGEKLKVSERRSWYRLVYPALLAHHQWLYHERDPHHEGLTLQIHPWETGLDNTPPWMAELHAHLLPWWIRVIKKGHIDVLATPFRRDTRYVPLDQRNSNIDALALYDALVRLRRKAYDINKVLDHALFAIEDLTFNSILMRANDQLLEIAATIREDVPEDLQHSIKLGRKTFEELWDPYSKQYYSRDFVTHHLIEEPSIAALMPLYSGVIPKERAEELVRALENHHLFGAAYPAPSAPLNSPWFKPKDYWQGPTWVNTNWLLIDGLRRYGFTDHANALANSTLEMVNSAGFYEYFDPNNGEPAGIDNFSWTAALTIDLLQAN